jgi:hypothetical protein
MPISFPFNLTNATKDEGTSGTYTCPAGKKALALVTLQVSYIKEASTGIVITHIDNTQSFLEVLDPGDTLEMVTNGSGVLNTSGSSRTSTASYEKNGVQQQGLSNGYTITAASGQSVAYVTNAKYTVLEFPI